MLTKHMTRMLSSQGGAPGQVIVGKEEVIVGFPDRSAAAKN